MATVALYKSVYGSPHCKGGLCRLPQRPDGVSGCFDQRSTSGRRPCAASEAGPSKRAAATFLPCGICPQSFRPPVGSEMPHAVRKAKGPPGETLRGERGERQALPLTVDRGHRTVHACSGAQCPTLCDPMNCGPRGSAVHGVLQARILGWVAMPFSRGPSRPRDQTWVSRTPGEFFTAEPRGKASEL